MREEKREREKYEGFSCVHTFFNFNQLSFGRDAAAAVARGVLLFRHMDNIE